MIVILVSPASTMRSPAIFSLLFAAFISSAVTQNAIQAFDQAKLFELEPTSSSELEPIATKFDSQLTTLKTASPTICIGTRFTSSPPVTPQRGCAQGCLARSAVAIGCGSL